MFGGEPQVEVNFHPIGDDVISANSAMDVDLKARWLKRLIAVVPVGFREPKEHRQGFVDRVACQMWIGDVAFDAVNPQFAGKRAAATDPDGIPQSL